MKKFLLCLLLTISARYHGQVPKGSYQAGISVLPIADFFNFFPDNSIKGVALSVNAGSFILPNLVCGFNPYYAAVSNSWVTQLSAGGSIEEEDLIKLYGLNAYLRYYLVNGKRMSFYFMLAGGFGNQEQKRVSGQPLPDVNTSVVVFMPGAGINFHITEYAAIELNVPYIKVNEAGTQWQDFLFHSVAPTIGFQFSWR